MQPTSEAIYEAAMKLSESERLSVVSRLLDATPAQDSSLALDDASLLEELERRFNDREEGPAWSDLRAEN